MFLKDFLVVLKLTVSPTYSCFESMLETVSPHQLKGFVGGVLQFLPILVQYSQGVIIFASLNRLAICVGPYPLIQRLNIFFTISAAGSSICQSLVYPNGGFVVSGTPELPLFLKTFLTFWLVFFACHSLNKSCIGTRSLIPFALSMLSIMAIYLTPSLSKSSSSSCPTTSLFLPSLEWSFTIRFSILPCSASSIISINAGLAKLVPDQPSSMNTLQLVKPLSFAYFSNIDC